MTAQTSPEPREDEQAAPGAPAPEPGAPVAAGAADEAAVEGEAEAVAEEAQALEEDIAELQAKARERDEYLALAQRTQADFENYRKRTAKDVAAAEGRGTSKLALELLPALDNLALALAAAESGVQSLSGAEGEGAQRLLEGIRLVGNELTAALARFGIEAYSPVGERFDPELHEAIAQHTVDGAASGTVAEVYQPGYRQNGSVLRAAKVVVAE